MHIQLNCERILSSAGQNIYLNGAKHPDRTMNEHDLVYIIEGKWEIYQNNTRYSLQADDVIFLSAHQHHYGLVPCDPKTRTMYLHVNYNSNDLFAPQTSEAGPDRIFLETQTHCRENKNVKSIFKNILLCFETDSPLKLQKLSCLVQLLLLELGECHAYSKQTQMLEKALLITQNKPDKMFKVDELAKMLYVSSRTFRNKFKQEYGKTFTQYQMENKLNGAVRFLDEYPDMKLSEIARNLGFYDEFHFSKAFKKHFNTSPSAYKKRN